MFAYSLSQAVKNEQQLNGQISNLLIVIYGSVDSPRVNLHRQTSLKFINFSINNLIINRRI